MGRHPNPSEIDYEMDRALEEARSLPQSAQVKRSLQPINSKALDAALAVDPLWLPLADEYYLQLARITARNALGALDPAGVVIVRGRQILSTGWTLSSRSGVELDAVQVAVSQAAGAGQPITGAIAYSTIYPMPHSFLMAWLAGVRRFVVLAADWRQEDEQLLRRTAALSRELGVPIDRHSEEDNELNDEDDD